MHWISDGCFEARSSSRSLVSRSSSVSGSSSPSRSTYLAVTWSAWMIRRSTEKRANSVARSKSAIITSAPTTSSFAWIEYLPSVMNMRRSTSTSRIPFEPVKPQHQRISCRFVRSSPLAFLDEIVARALTYRFSNRLPISDSLTIENCSSVLPS